LTSVDNGPFPSVGGDPYSWALDASAVNWQQDLLHNALTLVVQTDKTITPNWTYWFGSTTPSYAPSSTYAPALTIDYSAPTTIPEPSAVTLFGIGTVCMAIRAVCQRRRGARGLPCPAPLN
jgi:hypothetical protein